MRKGFFGAVLALGLLALLGNGAPARAADDYTLDAAHAGVNFRISHLGLSWVYGRFNKFSGNLTIDPDDPAKSAFALTINTDSVDTNNPQRDGHLRSPDFFNVKQFPTISFKSTAVKAIEGGYEVTGDFTLHGVTRSISFPLKGGKTAEFPKGVQRIGYTTELGLKRSEFGMDKFKDALGDEVQIAVSFEAVKK